MKDTRPADSRCSVSYSLEIDVLASLNTPRIANRLLLYVYRTCAQYVECPVLPTPTVKRNPSFTRPGPEAGTFVFEVHYTHDIKNQ